MFAVQVCLLAVLVFLGVTAALSGALVVAGLAGVVAVACAHGALTGP